MESTNGHGDRPAVAVECSRTGDIRILLGYQGGLLRAALAAALTSHVGFTVVAELDRSEDMPILAQQYRPDVVVLLDNGLAGELPISQQCHTFRDCPVLLVLDQASFIRHGRTLIQLLPQVGMISTDVTVAELTESIRRLLAGQPVADVRLAMVTPRPPNAGLTNREREVLRLASQGASTYEIATTLALSHGTTRNYVSRILTKTGARNLVSAILIARDAGWV